MSWEGEGGARAWVWLPSLPPTIYRAKGEGGAALPLPPRKGAARGESFPPKAPRRCLPLLGLSLYLISWRMGLLGLVPLAHIGQGAHPYSPCGPPGQVDPRTPFGTPGTIPIMRETFPATKTRLPIYINLYLRTILELLVMSRISSETPNNFR